MTEATSAAAASPSPFAGGDWFDPLEEAVRRQVRAFIEELLEEEDPVRPGDPGSGRPSGRPATAPGAPPVRPERHSPASIATLRRHLGVALMRRLPRCPCCLRAFQPQPTALML